MTERAVIPSTVGRLLIEAEEGGIVRVARCDQPLLVPEGALTACCCAQLNEYFTGARTVFDLPLRLKGTAFQRSVWQALCQIPYGETRSYGDIAAAIGNPGGMRAVGQANHVNPVLIIVPCHRVIRADGSLGGYGSGTEVKQYLLSLEKRRALATY